jgi:hypothetical protein
MWRPHRGEKKVTDGFGLELSQGFRAPQSRTATNPVAVIVTVYGNAMTTMRA